MTFKKVLLPFIILIVILRNKMTKNLFKPSRFAQDDDQVDNKV